MDEIIPKIETIVRKCGEKMLLATQETMNVEQKGGYSNLVTKYDKEIQETLKEELLQILPQANFVGEEEDLHSSILEEGYTFVVDPIDGTANFTRELSLSAVSVGLLKNGKSYIGVCYNPYTDEMYIAQSGKGAYLNGKPIKVSDKTLKEGLVLIGSASYYEELKERSKKTMLNFISTASDYRRFGAAVIEMCDVASGKAEVFYELRLQPWDYAAAKVIVEEAGGKVTTVDGEEVNFDTPCSMLASNNKEDYFKYIG